MNFRNFSIVLLTISSLALITSCDPLSGFYEWKDLLPNYVLPDNAVYGGQNVDLQPLFVARGKGSYFSYYGKVHMPIINRSAYLTNEIVEFSTTEFQVLTARGYVWCKPSYLTPSIEVICRARHNGFLTPGTLSGYACRVGFISIVHFYYEFEVLTIGTRCA